MDIRTSFTEKRNVGSNSAVIPYSFSKSATGIFNFHLDSVPLTVFEHHVWEHNRIVDIRDGKDLLDRVAILLPVKDFSLQNSS